MDRPRAEVADRCFSDKQLTIVSQLFRAFLILSDEEYLVPARFEDFRSDECHERSGHPANTQREFAIDFLRAKRECPELV
jgi:hypothetical protein